MPFTPIHLGAGLAVKAVGRQQVSLLIFAGSQVLMDIEPLLAIINGWPVLHGLSHTLGGALIIAMLAALIGKPLSQWLLRWLKLPAQRLTWRVALLSALIGPLSHIGLDAIMHSDMNPFWPIQNGNSWLGLITIDQLHLLCLGLGLFGATVIAIQYKMRRE